MIKRLFRSIFSFIHAVRRPVRQWIRQRNGSQPSMTEQMTDTATGTATGTTGQTAAESSSDRIVFSIPRAEVVRALNQTLWRSGTVTPQHPTSSHYQTANQRPEYTDHPDFIQSLADSAYICDCQGRYSEAERLYQQVLELSQRRYGEDHIEVANSLSDLAAFYCEQNRHSEAEPLLLRLVTVRSQDSSRAHAIGDALLRLGRLYLYQSQVAKAAPPLQQAVALFSEAFGTQDARTQAAQTAWEQTRTDDLPHY